MTILQTAQRFNIGVASITRWLKRIKPLSSRNKAATKIDMEQLSQDVANYPDSYIHERASRLGFSRNGIFSALRRLGVTYKKSPEASKGKRRQTAYLSAKDRSL